MQTQKPISDLIYKKMKFYIIFYNIIKLKIINFNLLGYSYLKYELDILKQINRYR